MQRRKEVFSNLNIVPYLDVMLVLLVIFMATTPVVQMGVTVNLPVGQAGPVKTDTPVFLSIDAQGQEFLQYGSEAPTPIKNKHDMKQWFSARQIGVDRPIHIQADQSLAWQKVLSALVQVNQMGWSKVSLMTQPERQEAS